MSSLMINESDWQHKLKIFTKYFTDSLIGPNLKVFLDHIKKEENVIDQLFGFLTAVAVFVGINRNKAKQINQICREIRNPEILIDACGDIFFSYQNQFTRVTDLQNDDESAMKKIATVAVQRIINYIHMNKNTPSYENCLQDFITKGVLLGNSESEKMNSLLDKDKRKLWRNDHLKKKYTEDKWNITEMFEETLILKLNENKNNEVFTRSDRDYKKGEQYGYRIGFEWEFNNSKCELQSVRPLRYNPNGTFHLTKEIIRDQLIIIKKQYLSKTTTINIKDEDKYGDWFNIKEPKSTFSRKDETIIVQRVTAKRDYCRKLFYDFFLFLQSCNENKLPKKN